jgi:NAD-dependent deacetylase
MKRLMHSISAHQRTAVPEQTISQDDERAIERVIQGLRRARRLLVITGAGMSADSGLPTYRGRDGLYRAQQTTAHGLSIEEVLSGHMLATHPEITWRYLLELEIATRGANPHRGHHVLAEMDRYFDSAWILTQNVDGLHQRAGSRNVLDMHGALNELRCMSCGRGKTVADYAGLSLPPRCDDCDGIFRPLVVLFGEGLPSAKLSRLWAELSTGFDVIFSIGTSSLFDYIVEPVRAGQRRGSLTVEINPDQTSISSLVDIKIRSRAAVALDRIWEGYLAWWPWA